MKSVDALARDDGVLGYKVYKNERKYLDTNLYLNDDAIKNKRNYEELYYKERHHERTNEYLELIKLKMQKPKGQSKDNLKPRYMEENQSATHKINKTISEIEYIKKSYRSPSIHKKSNFSKLETILEKQKIGLSSNDH